MSFKSGDYLNYIADLPCIVTGRRPVDCHHEAVLRKYSGTQKRKFDFGAIPLAHDVHIYQRHEWGKNKFWQHYQYDPIEVCIALLTVYINKGGLDSDKAKEALRMLLDEHYS
jgi:hypothetical protein